MNYIIKVRDGQDLAIKADEYIVNGDGYVELFRHNELVATFAPGWMYVGREKSHR